MFEEKIGLLPLYLEFYDNLMPEMRQRIEAFLKTIAEQFKKRGITVYLGDICRRKEEFRKTVKAFEENNVDAIVSLHLAYSLSLESAEVLADTKLPLIILDTSEIYDFGPDVEASETMYNHGIHGVQDLCNVLLRVGKNFLIEVGHWKESDVIERVVKKIKIAYISRKLSKTRVGRIGGPFSGMGDIDISSHVLKKKIGIETIEANIKEICSFLSQIKDEELKKEIEFNKDNYTIDNIEDKVYLNSIKIGLAVRKWMKVNNLSAFTLNPATINLSSGFPALPLLEASKAMFYKIGYAGDGDVLNAAFVGSILTQYPQTSFVEMFCADWKAGRIFLSHMGEINLSVLAEKPLLIHKKLNFLEIKDNVIAVGRLKPGVATILNIAPIKNNNFRLIISNVEVLDLGKYSLTDAIRGWFVPAISLEEFLKKFSSLGGTHHSVLVYGNVVDDFISLARINDWQIEII